MQITLLDTLTTNLCPISLDDVHQLIGPPPDQQDRDTCLITHDGDHQLGAMRIRLPYYPVIKAEAPMVCRDAEAAAITRALLTALQHEVFRQARLEAELIQDMPPADSQDLITCHLTALGFEDIGRSIYMSKCLHPASMPQPDNALTLISAREYGMDRFLQAMVVCAQPPITDQRTQPCCLSLERAALTVQDIAGNGQDQCFLACDGNTVSAVAIASAGFLAWLAVHPEARRGGTGRRVLLALEHIWVAQAIRRAGLQVLSTNPGALALYRTLGYASHGENSPRIWRWRNADVSGD